MAVGHAGASRSLGTFLRESAPPPFDVVRAAQAELVVTDLAAAEEFYAGALGLCVAERTSTALYVRGWEERLRHSLVLRLGERPALDHVAFRVGSPEDLEVAERWFGDRGLPARRLDEGAGSVPRLAVQDPQGLPLHFFCAAEPAPTQLQRFHLQRGAPILRFDHFNFHVPAAERAAAFWLSLGFRCSEYISTDSEPAGLTGCWLTRKPSVHDVALTLGTGPRLHHLGLWVGEPMGVMRACDQLASAGYAANIERGPGRHGVSNAFFVYLRDPDGHRIELYTCDYWTGDPGHEPLRWSASDPSCRSFWGTRAPDSWYEESTPVLDLDGRPVPATDAELDERSELMG